LLSVFKVISRTQNAPAFETMSEFLSLLELRGRTWCFVEIGESGGFSIPPGDDVFFYAILKGTARIAGVGDSIIELQAGHVAMILSGESHALRNLADSRARTLAFLRDEQTVDIPLTVQIGTGPVSTRILCGRLVGRQPGETGQYGAIEFTAKVGRTPMDVITELRMQHATSLLQHDELKIA
jgi:hypothetical protein